MIISLYFVPPINGACEGGAALKCQDKLPDNTKASRATRMKIPET
jgi:hypothetical protein